MVDYSLRVDIRSVPAHASRKSAFEHGEINAGVQRVKDNPGPTTTHNLDVTKEMSIRQDWTKITRSVTSFFATFRSAIGSTSEDRQTRRARSRKRRPVTLTIRYIADLPMVTELELYKSRALIYNARNQIR